LAGLAVALLLGFSACGNGGAPTVPGAPTAPAVGGSSDSVYPNATPSNGTTVGSDGTPSITISSQEPSQPVETQPAAEACATATDAKAILNSMNGKTLFNRQDGDPMPSVDDYETAFLEAFPNVCTVSVVFSVEFKVSFYGSVTADDGNKITYLGGMDPLGNTITEIAYK